MENVKNVVAEFEERISVVIKRQEKIYKAENREFRRKALSEKYIAKILYKWNI